MNTTTEEEAMLAEAASLVLAEIRNSQGNEIAIITAAFVMCGTAAAEQGIAAVLAEREACAKIATSHRSGAPYSGDADFIADAIRARTK